MTPAADKTLFVPLLSNASQLLAGAPVEAVRRKLKYASIVYDRLLLENGSISVQAGRGGSSTLGIQDEAFQTVAERRVGMKGGFYLAIGLEDPSGASAPPDRMSTIIAPRTAAISWRPTLIPFEDELPRHCNWINWINLPRDPEVSKLASEWSYRDCGNDALLAAVPEPFARSLIIHDANTDLARAALSGVAVMQDATHRQVMSARLNSRTTWQPVGFAVPVLAPRVGALTWDEIATLRADRAIRTYRAVLRDLEAEALEASANGADVERVLNVQLQKRLAKLAEPPRGAASVLFNGVVSFFVGSGIGAVTVGWTHPGSIFGGAALGSVFNIGLDSSKMIRARAARNWVSLHQKLGR